LSTNGHHTGPGARVRRVEDPAFLLGARPYTDDLREPEALYAVYVRSVFAYAKIGSIDTSAALEAPGVVGVYTAADLKLEPQPAQSVPEAMRRPVLASDVVRFIGELVAVVVADTRAHAVDAAELVEVDYDPLDALIDPEKALDAGAPVLFPDNEKGNVCTEGTNGTGDDVLAGAEVVVGGRFLNQRLAAVPMEPSAGLAAPDPDRPGAFILWTPSQNAHSHRDAVAESLALEPENLRVITPATGGGFGARIATNPEEAALVALARELNRPVRFIETRSETMLAMVQGRAQIQDVELAGTRDGRVTGVRARVIADCGAYPANATDMPMLTGLMLCGVYDIPKVDYAYTGVVTNTTPVGAYRGAGRPEATALIERAMDMYAKAIGLDPAEVRRKNFVTEFPHKTVTGADYDSGDYGAALDAVLEAAGYEDLRAEQAARRERDDARQLGLGLCSYVEWTGFGTELGTCEVGEDGVITVRSGASAHGQGHETAFAQLVSGALGVAIEDVRVIQADTGKVARGMGTMGSRSLQVGGSAIHHAAGEVLEQGRRIAARRLEADAEDIVVHPGAGLGVAGSPGTAIPWGQLAATAVAEGGELAAERDYEPEGSTFPYGCHLSVVEVDLETGSVDILRHVTVDDAGTITNPMLVEGQVHGGIAQGLAQALFEEVAYDGFGNNVTGTLVSYAMPSASDLPTFETTRTETPTPRNPLGAKGIGEAGTIGSTPAAWNAVIDAVSHLGIDHIQMPANPQRMWEAITEARR
jgi:aerobic carbon-monoxide dehydrogenase large subunit